MGTNTLTKACGTCNQVTPHTQQTPNHVLHLLLSLITVGLWVPIWLLIALFGNGAQICQQCQMRAMQARGR